MLEFAWRVFVRRRFRSSVPLRCAPLVRDLAKYRIGAGPRHGRARRGWHGFRRLEVPSKPGRRRRGHRPFDERSPWCNKISGAIHLGERGVEGAGGSHGYGHTCARRSSPIAHSSRRDGITPRRSPESPPPNPREHVRGGRARDQRCGASRLGPATSDRGRSRKWRPLHRPRPNTLRFGAFLGSMGDLAHGACGDTRELPHSYRPAVDGARAQRVGNHSAEARHTLEFPGPQPQANSRERWPSRHHPLPPEHPPGGSRQAHRLRSRR